MDMLQLLCNTFIPIVTTLGSLNTTSTYLSHLAICGALLMYYRQEFEEYYTKYVVFITHAINNHDIALWVKTKYN